MDQIIDKCRICDAKGLEDFFDLGDQPFANSLPKILDGTEKKHPLALTWCPDCNCVQLTYTADPKELFMEYVWVTGTSGTAQKHAYNFLDGIKKRLPNVTDGYVMEAASNDGTFLKPFIEQNIKVLGIDPAENIVKMAVKDGIPTTCAFFGEDAAKNAVAEHGKAKVVFARNVLPHVANLHDFVEGMAQGVSDDGMVVVEFHYAKPIQDDLHYDSIYHEHLCYYTLKSIERLLNIHGLYVFDLEESPINAGNVAIYMTKDQDKPASNKLTKYRTIEAEEKVNSLEKWTTFAERSKAHKGEILALLNASKSRGAKIIGYGASARASTMLNYCEVGENYLSKIADKNPLKHNRFSAGTHVLINDPDIVMKEEQPDCIFLLAWNFKDEILQGLKDDYQFKGECIVPLPEPHVVQIG